MIILRYTLLHYILFIGLLPSVMGQVQSRRIDSLDRSFRIRSSYFYIKPMVGFMQNPSRINGSDRFTAYGADERRHRVVGFFTGYQNGRLGIETGLTTLLVSSGYQFDFLPNPYLSSTGAYFQLRYSYVPLIIRYLVWQPKQRLSLHIAAGAGFGWGSKGVILNKSTLVTESSFTSPDGVQLTTQTRQESTVRNAFWASTIGLSGSYILSKHFNVDLQLTRFLTPQTTLDLNTTIQPHNEATSYTARTTGGVRGTALMLGVSYRFGIQKRYKLIE